MKNNDNLVQLNSEEEKNKNEQRQLLELVQKNRKLGVTTLQKKTEAIAEELEKAREVTGQSHALLNLLEDEQVVFSLENNLRNTLSALEGALTSLESLNSITDMVIHDIGGFVHNLEQTQKAILITNSHNQNLVDTLLKKGVITEDELKENWEEVKKKVNKEQKESG